MDEIGADSPSSRPERVGVLPLDGFALMSYAALVEPMRAANLLSRRPLYEVIELTVDGAPARSSGAALVEARARVGDDLDLDALFVLAGGDPARFRDRRVFAWLARQARFGVMMGGVSGGPLILARAGLMQGRRMTIHWEHAPALAEVSPALLIERTLFVIDRDRVTCAGGMAAMDMMHALIARRHGAMFARLVSDWFLHTEIRPAIGPQRGGLAARTGTTEAAVLAAVEAMESHVADPLTLGQLAAVAGVSPRQLERLFRREIGVPVMAHYRGLRLETADRLLRTSSLSMTEIALAAGFSGSSHFSRLYRAHFGRPPSAARRLRGRSGGD